MIELGIAQTGPEKRSSSGSYTDAVVTALLQAASGSVSADPSTLGALEVCAGAWSRAFASATVQPQTAISAAVSPSALATIGRGLIRRGQTMHLIDVGVDGGVELLDVGHWDTRGHASRSSWFVRADLHGPDTTITRTVAYSGVIHCRYAFDPARPWIGVGPLSWALQTGRLAAALERALADEAGSPVGSVIPVPEGNREPTDEDEDDADPLAGLKADIAKLRGSVALVETMSGGHGDRGGRPDSDWKAHRIGAHPPDVLNEIRTAAAMSVFGACGVPPSLFMLPADGTGQREAWRRFLHGSVSPVARMVADELRLKLEIPDLTLSFDSLYAADLSGRARAWRSLVGKAAAMDADKAARLAGLA